jgi:hypothetical protein
MCVLHVADVSGLVQQLLAPGAQRRRFAAVAVLVKHADRALLGCALAALGGGDRDRLDHAQRDHAPRHGFGDLARRLR